MHPLIQSLFGIDKPVIAMLHLPALPGTPKYDATAGMDGILNRVKEDIQHLIKCGVDAVLFCNEDDRPYSLDASMEAVAAMTRVITELRPENIPYGVDYLWDAFAPLAIAKATGAAFIREVITGVYESDMGLWVPNAAALYRYRRQIDADNIHIFANITPEFASALGSRSVADRARSAVVSTMVDAILISGAMAGSEPDITNLIAAREGAAGQVPVFLNTGAKTDNIHRYLEIADGVIVGSSLKVDGFTWNPIDPVRVETFMQKVRQVRSQV